MSEEFFLEQEKKLLELEKRKLLYTIVKEFAGSHFREIERKSHLSTGVVRHHLVYLKKFGLISEVKEGHSARYYPKDVSSKNKTLLGFLRQSSVRTILLFMLLNAPCTHKEITDYTKRSPSTISWHLKKLEEKEIIKSKKSGRQTSFSLLTKKEELVRLLLSYQESFFDKLVDQVVDMWDLE